MLEDTKATKILTGEGMEKLELLVPNFQDIFAIKLGLHEPADVPPLGIRLKPDANPIKIPSRTYAPPQMRYMKEKLDEYEAMGLIYQNPDAPWESPSLILPKTGPEKFRFTVHLRNPNS